MILNLKYLTNRGNTMQKISKYLMITILILSVVLPELSYSKTGNNTTLAKKKTNRMNWWREANFGMFIHWGLYSIPAGKWKEDTMYAEWIRNSAQIPLKTYDNFLSDFNPVNYNPEKWVNLAQEAGMKYIVITTKHHDGFCLFDSDYTDFDVTSTPYKKDLLKPLAKECHRQGIKLGWYYSIMDWHHPDYLPRRDWEKNRPTKNANFDHYFRYMKNQLNELLTDYGNIGLLWFDGEWEKKWNDRRGLKLYNYVRSLQKDIIVNDRVGASRIELTKSSDEINFLGDYLTPEQKIPNARFPNVDWETCMTMNNHWGYNKYDNNWKSTQNLIRKLIDIVSKGGNLLLNVGPKADGTFPKESISRLKNIGNWMDKHGKSIYGTGASPFKNLEWGRCTKKKLPDGTTNLYMHIFNWPEDNVLIVPGLVSTVKSVNYLGHKSNKLVSYTKDKDNLKIKLDPKYKNKYASVLTVNIEGAPQIAYAPKIVAPNNKFVKNIQISLKSSIESPQIYYTLNGKKPTIDSKVYDNPIKLSQSAPFKARIFMNGKAISPLASYRFQKVDPQPALNISNSKLKKGILQKEYQGNWDHIPNFSKLDPKDVKIKSRIRVDNTIGKEHFGYRYLGYIKIKKDGVYKFWTMSDDGSKLYINDQLVVDNGGLHSSQYEEGNIALSEGYHKIKIDYFDKTGGNILKVFYKYKDGNKKELPENILFID